MINCLQSSSYLLLAIKNGMCSPDINWKHFFASEVAEKASQTLKVKLDTFSQQISNFIFHLLLFYCSQQCNLLDYLFSNLCAFCYTT